MTNVKFSQVQSLAPHMASQYNDAFNAPTVSKILTKYGIAKTPLRVAHFFAQILAETGALTDLQESLNYSAAGLMSTWPNRFPTLAIANEYAHQEAKIGDFVYGGRMGNTNPGDGFMFRGRGLLQITGREAYTRFGTQLGIPLAQNPDLAFSSANCLEVAAAEWSVSGYKGRLCNDLADDDDIVGVTYAINGGQIGIDARRAWLQRAKGIWLSASPAPVASLSSHALANTEGAPVSVVEGFPADPRVPAGAVSPAPTMPATATLTASLPFDAKAASLYGQFVQAAYSMYSLNLGNAAALTPPTSQDFPGGYGLTAWIRMQDFILQSTAPSFYGFIAQSKVDPSQFVVAIRGTSNGIEWWDDANAVAKTPFKIPGCGSVGTGFARIYDTLEVVECPTATDTLAAPRTMRPAGGFSQQVAALVQRHRPMSAVLGALPRSATVEVTGHSLGAALATLYVMENAHTDQIANPSLCTFASPLVGDATFAAAFNGLGLTSWRVDNVPDLVPKVPPEILGFVHVDTEVPINSTGKVWPLANCWHSLATYLSLIDPTKQPESSCRLPAAMPPPGLLPPGGGPQARPTGFIGTPRKIARYGWKPDLPDQRDFSYAVTKSVAQNISSSVNLRAQCPAVYDQGQIGSCTANAIAAALEFDMMKQGPQSFTPSRLFIYYNERYMEGTVGADAGAQIRDGIKSVASQGDCPETLWPYFDTPAVNGVFPANAKPAMAPGPECYANAVQHKALTYQSVDQNLADMKGCLASGYPFVFGFTVYPSFESDAVASSGVVPMPGAGEQTIGGHAVLAVGYDDAKNWFVVRNSWGPKWGDGGYFYMPYAYLLDSNLSDDFWTIRVVGS